MAIASSDSTKAKDTSYFHNTNGKISECRLSGCYGECCKFNRPGYAIVLHPGELRTAYESGLSTAHLRIVNDNFNGGQLAVCRAHDKINCDDGYKPLDCICYPFFTVVDKTSGTKSLVADHQCKLISNECDLEGHIEKITRLVDSLIQRDPSLIDFFAASAPKDYFPYRPRTSTLNRQQACTLGNE